MKPEKKQNKMCRPIDAADYRRKLILDWQLCQMQHNVYTHHTQKQLQQKSERNKYLTAISDEATAICD